MNKHTPGPWEAVEMSDDKDNPQEIAFAVLAKRQPMFADYNDICYVWKRGGKEKTAANARLIEAAPDLLAALINIAYMADTSGDAAILAEAKEAIAKATGEA